MLSGVSIDPTTRRKQTPVFSIWTSEDLSRFVQLVVFGSCLSTRIGGLTQQLDVIIQELFFSLAPFTLFIEISFSLTDLLERRPVVEHLSDLVLRLLRGERLVRGLDEQPALTDNKLHQVGGAGAAKGQN